MTAVLIIKQWKTSIARFKSLFPFETSYFCSVVFKVPLVYWRWRKFLSAISLFLFYRDAFCNKLQNASTPFCIKSFINLLTSLFSTQSKFVFTDDQCSFEKMDNIRDLQEKLARLHFRMDEKLQAEGLVSLIWIHSGSIFRFSPASTHLSHVWQANVQKLVPRVKKSVMSYLTMWITFKCLVWGALLKLGCCHVGILWRLTIWVWMGVIRALFREIVKVGRYPDTQISSSIRKTLVLSVPAAESVLASTCTFEYLAVPGRIIGMGTVSKTSTIICFFKCSVTYLHVNIKTNQK